MCVLNQLWFLSFRRETMTLVHSKTSLYKVSADSPKPFEDVFAMELQLSLIGPAFEAGLERRLFILQEYSYIRSNFPKSFLRHPRLDKSPSGRGPVVTSPARVGLWSLSLPGPSRGHSPFPGRPVVTFLARAGPLKCLTFLAHPFTARKKSPLNGRSCPARYISYLSAPSPLNQSLAC